MSRLLIILLNEINALFYIYLFKKMKKKKKQKKKI